MAGEGSGQADHLIDQLVRDARRFDFNQAVRLTYRLAALTGAQGAPLPGRLASAAAPADEPVRFHCHPASRFPTASLHEVRRNTGPSGNRGETARADQAAPVPLRLDMTVLFAGLTGPNGALPRHYTTLLVEQRRENNLALEQFQDLFNHRLISLFYRAWEKHRFPIAIEQTRLARGNQTDPFTRCLLALVGVSLDRQRDRMSVDDRSLLFFAGHYSRKVPTACGIRDTLAEYFQTAVRIEQFVGEWLGLDRADRSCFGTAERPLGQNMQLGINTVVGDRIWYSQNRFRIHLGPLKYEQYRRFLPDQSAMRELCELVRMHVGPAMEFDVVPALLGSEVPPCQLGGDDAPRLGWTSFLTTVPYESEFNQARFERPDL